MGSRLPTLGRSRTGRQHPSRVQLASAAGDTLIEVLVSALLVGLIVVGIFSGLNSTNRVTSIDRARSQADALAEQNEEQLRSEPIKKLDELESHPEIKTVTEGKNVYTIETSATYFPDASATSSCTSSTEKAIYLQTTSKVTSQLIGTGKAVEENGIISPPAGSALIVQVQYSGTALQGAKVTAVGPSPATSSYSLETSIKGCAILAVPPGEYNIYVSKLGYVTPNGFENTHEDASTTHSVYLAAETTAKEGYNIGKAGKLKVSFENPTTKSLLEGGDSFVAQNTLMTGPRKFTTEPVGTYKAPAESSTSIFPFTGNYTIYAGTCESDAPSASIIEANPKNFLATVPPGETYNITTLQPPVNILVKNGKSASEPGTTVNTAAGSTTDGCGVKRSFTSTPSGALPHPGLPFGTYSMCVGNGGRIWKGTFENNSTTGPSSTEWTNGHSSPSVATIYLGAGATGVETGSCP